MGKTRSEPGDVNADLAEIFRRLHALETASPMRRTSMTEGTTRFLDGGGQERVSVGIISTGDYGFEVMNEAGLPVYRADSDGVSYPRQPLQMFKAGDYVSVASGTFTRTWNLVCSYATGDAVQVQVYLLADAATTGEAQLTVNLGGSPVTAIQAIPAASGAYFEWKWAPPGLVVGTGPIQVGLEIRRTSGAGSVYAYPPNQAFHSTAAAIAATPTGV